MPERARLTVFAEGGIEVSLVTDFLRDASLGYESLVAFDKITEPRRIQDLIDPFFISVRGLRRRYSVTANLLPLPRDQREATALVFPSERLLLSRVRINSPGFWTFLGNLNPLEVLRQYINDRHERRKDKDYRERAEERRLALENLSLENRVIRERIGLLREMGFGDSEIAPLLNQLVYQPLSKLNRYQDVNSIKGAKLDDGPPTVDDSEHL